MSILGLLGLLGLVFLAIFLAAKTFAPRWFFVVLSYLFLGLAVLFLAGALSVAVRYGTIAAEKGPDRSWASLNAFLWLAGFSGGCSLMHWVAARYYSVLVGGSHKVGSQGTR